MIYVTTEGDRLDRICWQRYRSVVGTVEAVLDANPRLALEPPVLAAGLSIELPDLDTETRPRELVRLWT